MTALITSFKKQSTIYFSELLQLSANYSKNGRLYSDDQSKYGQLLFDFNQLISDFVLKNHSASKLQESLFVRMSYFQEIVLESILRNTEITSGINAYLKLQNDIMQNLIDRNAVSDEELIWDHSINLVLTIFDNLSIK